MANRIELAAMVTSNRLQIKYSTDRSIEDGGRDGIFEYTGHETTEERL